MGCEQPFPIPQGQQNGLLACQLLSRLDKRSFVLLGGLDFTRMPVPSTKVLGYYLSCLRDYGRQLSPPRGSGSQSGQSASRTHFPHSSPARWPAPTPSKTTGLVGSRRPDRLRRRTQPAAVRRRHRAARARARHRRGGQRQDPHPDLPRRLPARKRRRSVQHPPAHLHQQGRARDAGARFPPPAQQHRGPLGRDVPLHRQQNPAPPRGGPRASGAGFPSWTARTRKTS